MRITDIEKVDEGIPTAIKVVRAEVLARTAGMEIRPGNEDDYKSLVAALRSAATVKDQIKGFFAPMKKRLDEAKKAVLAGEKEQLAPLEEFEVRGKAQVALWVRETAKISPLPSNEFVPPKVEGSQIRHLWSAEVDDLKALLAFVVANPHMLHLVQPNQSALDSLARSMKDSGITIPGVTFVRTDSVAISAL